MDPNRITRDQWHTVDQTRSTPDLTPAPKVHLVYLRLPSAQSCCGAALGGSHPCAQDEPEPGAPRERRRFPHNSAQMLTRDTGGLVIGQSESGRRAARYKLTHQDWPGGLGPKKCSLASLSDMAVFRSQSGRQVTWDLTLTEVGDRAKFSVQAVPE